jgi:exosortase E/protease (VPEID-CTERM system)
VLILIGHAGYIDIAIGGFHSKAGWLFFCAIALGAVWASQHLRWFARDPNAARDALTNPSAPFLLPLLAVVATSLVTGLFVDDFDYFYPLRVAVGLLVLAWYRKDYMEGLRAHLHGRRIASWHAVGVGVAVYLLWIGISALTDDYRLESAPEALTELATPLAAVWIVGRALGAILLVPIVEELAFRGFLLRRLIGSNFTKVSYEEWHWPAVLISSLAFAAAHQQWIGGFAAGLLYAYAQKRRGLVSDAIVAHAVTNALIAMQVLFAGHWSLW